MKKPIKKRGYKTINLVVVHGNEFFRLGLKTLFDRTNGIRVIGEVNNLDGAITWVKRYQPIVVLMDIRLINDYALGEFREILVKAPDTRLVLLVNAEDPKHALTAIRFGAKGVLLKSISGQALTRAIQTVAAGHSLLDPKITDPVFTLIKNLPDPPEIPSLTSLTSQERQVVDHLTSCKTNKEIASALGLSAKTIQNYLAGIYEKLNITRRCQIVVLLAQRHS